MHLICIYLYTFLMCVTENSASSIFDTFVHFEPLDGKKCNSSDVVIETTSRSIIGCGLECDNTIGCGGFMYNEQTKSCIGCGEQYESGDTLASEVGTQYFIGEWFSFGDDWYKLSATNITFYEGVTYCNTSRGQIATLDTEAKNEFIAQKLQDFEIEGNVWIGLTDEAQEGVWIWVTTGQVANYTNWKTDGDNPQPNGWDEDNCVNLAKGYRFEWADKKCSREQQVLCERLATPKRR